MQKLWLSSELEGEYGDAQIEVVISLLVHRNALTDRHKEEFFGERIAAATGSQALSSDLAHVAQIAVGDGQAIE